MCLGAMSAVGWRELEANGRVKDHFVEFACKLSCRDSKSAHARAKQFRCFWLNLLLAQN